MMIDGMILLNKPEGVTSFKALATIKKKLNTKKVGHTGTLDKFASGLLILLTGKMTKFAPYITGMDKTYLAKFEFGKTTTTLDPEGEVLNERDIPDIETIKKSIKNNFLGEIYQVPPDFSAVHIGGKRAYQLKLKGEEVNIPPRKIKINKFEVLNWDGKNLDVEISCSKGTYIRSIARDLGEICNSSAYVTSLKRTAVGSFKLNNAVDGDDFTADHLIEPFDLINALGKNYSFVTDKGATEISMGKKIESSFFYSDSPKYSSGEVALFTKDKKLVAMVENSQGRSKYLFVVPR